MEDEVIRFEITDHDSDNEFSSRRGKPLTKEQKIYGIWANDDSDDDNKRTSFKSSRESKNYSAPIDFIAGGIHKVGDKKDEESETKEKQGSLKMERDSSDSEDNEDFAFSRPSFCQESKSTTTEITGDIAGLRRKKDPSHSTLINRGVGNWEKHTKGIGAKLLLQMGFQPGKGLGKDSQGISTPVEAHLRKGRGAIGAYGPEKKTKVAPLIEIDNLKEEGKEDQNGESKWKKMSEKKSRYYFRSVDDVIERGKRPGAYRTSGVSSELSKVKVIDMTGPQQRISSGYHASSGLRAPPGVEHFEDVIHKKCSNFALPEIQHNVDSSVDMTEQEIIHLDRKNRMNKDRITVLKQEEESSVTILEKEDALVENLKSVMEMVGKLVDPSQSLSSGQVSEMFQELQNEFFEEYCRYESAELAPGLVGPLLTSAMAKWSPVVTPREFLYVFEQWKAISERHSHKEINPKAMRPYDSSIWHTWSPVMRTCVASWNPRDCDASIGSSESWSPVSPSWIADNVYDQSIVPRSKEEVDNWNPMTDTVPIHTWIHPWIPSIDGRLKDKIYPIIQEKLGAALTNWHPSDRSAKFMSQPWKRVSPDGSFVGFSMKHVVPKSQSCMQSSVISPMEQHSDNWNWVMDWKDMISTGNMTLISDKFFFPRWIQTLNFWSNNGPNYTQVTDWYLGWKRMVSEELLAHPTIKGHFHRASESMNGAANSETQPGAKESISYLKTIETNVPPPPPPPIVSSFDDIAKSAKMPKDFKESVAKKCEDRGILYVPIPNKFREAKQVYRMGNNGVQCYIDGNVSFYSKNNSSWSPIGHERLMDMA